MILIMRNLLNRHPFAVEAFFSRSLVITFATPAANLVPLLPPCLLPDTFQNEWGFVAAAFVQTHSLRPKGWPKWMGHDFFLAGYRIFVRYHTSYGKNLRGLYILQSQTDQKKMEWLGNVFTRYRYGTIDVRQITEKGSWEIFSEMGGLDIAVNFTQEAPALPASSPFANWKEARRFAGPLPFTFSYLPKEKKMLIVEGVREDWQPKPVQIDRLKIQMPAALKPIILQPANAFLVENIPYAWKKGRTDLWQP